MCFFLTNFDPKDDEKELKPDEDNQVGEAKLVGG
jgi:hypothetical protein